MDGSPTIGPSIMTAVDTVNNRQSIEGLLGGHPARAVFAKMGLSLVMVMAVALIAASIDRRLAGSAVFLGTGTLVLFASLDFDRLISAWRNAALFRQAVTAVACGNIRADLVLRSPTCSGIAILDRQSRRLFINGSLIGFGDVLRATAKSTPRRHWVEIVLASGRGERIDFADREVAERSARLIEKITAAAVQSNIRADSTAA
jgi:hypothetical protein